MLSIILHESRLRGFISDFLSHYDRNLGISLSRLDKIVAYNRFIPGYKNDYRGASVLEMSFLGASFHNSGKRLLIDDTAHEHGAHFHLDTSSEDIRIDYRILTGVLDEDGKLLKGYRADRMVYALYPPVLKLVT